MATMTREEALHEMKALPTWYRGVHYRSRAEARWAVFFDYLREKAGADTICYYEAQGFITDGQGYLPDFHFPAQKLIAEVKPSIDADPDGVQKLRNLVAARGLERGVVLPAIGPGEMRLLVIGPDGKGETWEDDRGTWLCCPYGYHFDVQLYPDHGCTECPSDGGYWCETEEIGRAYAFARNYRFGRQ